MGIIDDQDRILGGISGRGGLSDHLPWGFTQEASPTLSPCAQSRRSLVLPTPPGPERIAIRASVGRERGQLFHSTSSAAECLVEVKKNAGPPPRCGK